MSIFGRYFGKFFGRYFGSSEQTVVIASMPLIVTASAIRFAQFFPSIEVSDLSSSVGVGVTTSGLSLEIQSASINLDIEAS